MLAATAGGAGWAVAELARPRRTDTRFDPDDVAGWGRPCGGPTTTGAACPCSEQLVALLQGQFHLQPLRAVALAGLAARAAAVFQVAEATTTTGALPYLERYYAGIQAVSEVPFDPRRAAGWSWSEWMYAGTSCTARRPGGRALADLAAELYQVPAERLWAHASRRAEAMTIRDHAATREVGVLEDDWDRIEAVLWVAWKALADEVQGPPGGQG